MSFSYLHIDQSSLTATRARAPVNYLLNYRLQWGQPDTLSVLRSSLDERPAQKATNGTTPSLDPKTPGKLPPLPADAPRYFRADIPPELLSITMNDWPYSGTHPHPHPNSPPAY